MDSPILSQEELRQWLTWAMNFAHPEDARAHLMAIAQALELDTAVVAAGRGLTEMAEHLFNAVRLVPHRTLNGGW